PAAECTLESGAVRIGLAAVKHLTKKSRERILAARPFADLADLLDRTTLALRELEALVLCGACDRLAPLARETYPFVHEDVLARLAQDRSKRALQEVVPRRASGEHAGMYGLLARIANELRFLDMF